MHRMAAHKNRRWTLQYLKLLLGMRMLELRSGLYDLLQNRQDNARHVLIYAQGRSGTTLLASLLVSTGHFTDLSEPLHLYTREVWAPVRHLRGLGHMTQGNVVAHVKGAQLVRERRRPVDAAGFLRALHDQGWTIVHVHRRGIADQVLSECTALARGAYHKTDDRPLKTRLRIDPAEFMRRYDRRLEFRDQDRAALKGLPHIAFCYEDDLMDGARHQATADRICTALGLPLRAVCSDLRRIGSTDPRERLENYHEIEAALAERGINWSVGPPPDPIQEVGP